MYPLPDEFESQQAILVYLRPLPCELREIVYLESKITSCKYKYFLLEERSLYI